MNNRTLLIVFGVCLALFLGAKLLKGNKSSSFDDAIVKVDSASVDHIKFISAGNHPEEFELNDSLASKVRVWHGKNQVADLEVGGFRFDQNTRSAFSFIKNANKPEVYEVDGFLSMGLKARFNQFREKQLVKASQE